MEDEDNTHMFYQCTFAKKVLRLMCEHIRMPRPITENTEDFINWWSKKNKNHRNIPALYHWTIWCNKNHKIFRGINGNPRGTVDNIIFLWESLRTEPTPTRDLSCRMRLVEIQYPVGFFDGASQLSSCRCGVWLRISPTCHYKIHWSGGFGTNMRAEILALWGLLWIASQLCIDDLWVFGDSKVLVDYVNRGNKLDSVQHETWLVQHETWLVRIEKMVTGVFGHRE